MIIRRDSRIQRGEPSVFPDPSCTQSWILDSHWSTLFEDCSHWPTVWFDSPLPFSVSPIQLLGRLKSFLRKYLHISWCIFPCLNHENYCLEIGTVEFDLTDLFVPVCASKCLTSIIILKRANFVHVKTLDNIAYELENQESWPELRQSIFRTSSPVFTHK